MTKILQNNVGKGGPAMGHIAEYMTENNFDAAILQEPRQIKGRVTGGPKGFTAFMSPNNKSCILIKKEYMACQVFAHKGTVATKAMIKGTEIILVSLYCSPNDPDDGCISTLEGFLSRLKKQEVLFGGDINAKSPMWGSKKLDKRGRLWEEFILASNLQLMNVKGPPTFRSDCEKTSYIDITLATAKLNSKSIWKNDSGESKSDHEFLTVNIGEVRDSHSKPSIPERRRHAISLRSSKIFLRKFKKMMPKDNKLESKKDIDEYLLALVETIKKAAKPKNRVLHKEVPWWNEDLRIERGKVKALRRLAQKEQEDGERKRKLLIYKKSCRKI